jgi:hypothetical protein
MAMVLVGSPPEKVNVEVFADGGPWVKHNMPCSVCHDQSAVYNISTGILEPCWECQRRGFRLCRRRRSWLARFFIGEWRPV